MNIPPPLQSSKQNSTSSKHSSTSGNNQCPNADFMGFCVQFFTKPDHQQVPNDGSIGFGFLLMQWLVTGHISRPSRICQHNQVPLQLLRLGYCDVSGSKSRSEIGAFLTPIRRFHMRPRVDSKSSTLSSGDSKPGNPNR